MPFIDGARLQQANAQARQRAERVEKLPLFPVGHNNVILTGVKALVNEKTGVTEVHVEVTDPNGVYRTINEVLRIAPKKGEELQQYHDINLQILGGYFLSAFNHELQNAETLAGFVKQFTPYLKKPLQIVVQHQQRIMEPKNPGDPMTMFLEQHIWYTGDINKDQLTFNAAELVKPLSAKEQTKWNDFKGTKKVAKGVNSDMGTTAVSRPAAKGPEPDFSDKGTPENAEAEAAEDESAEVEGDVTFE